MWLKPNLKHPSSKMTLQVIWAGNIFFPRLPSQVNSMRFKRGLWIQQMALLRTIKEHGWLIIYGQCGGHSHSCMHLTMESYLYSSWESAVPFKTNFQAKVENSDHLTMFFSSMCSHVSRCCICYWKNLWILWKHHKKCYTVCLSSEMLWHKIPHTAIFEKMEAFGKKLLE